MADVEMQDASRDVDLIVPRVIDDNELRSRVREMLEDQANAGYVRLLRGSPGLRARGVRKPENWAIARKFRLEKAIHAYLDAREHNPNGDSTIEVLLLFEAIQNEWRGYVLDMLKATVPEFLGIDFDTYLDDGVVFSAKHMYKLVKKRLAEYAKVRRRVADSYETAEGFILMSMSDPDDIAQWKLTEAVDAVYKQMSFDMTPDMREIIDADGHYTRQQVPYEMHIARLCTTAINTMMEVADAVFARLLSEFQDQLASGIETELWRISRNAVRAMALPLQRTIFFLTLHLMDDRTTGGYYLTHGRFGRQNNWAPETGVRHGRWPQPVQTPKPTPPPVAPVPRSRTPSPTLVDERKPPKTSRTRGVRNARTELSSLAPTRRVLNLSADAGEPSP